MFRILSTATAALAASPLLIAEPGQARDHRTPAVDQATTQTLTTQCKFYVNTLASDAEGHMKGNPIMTPRQMAAFGAIAMLERAHDAIGEDGEPANDDSSKLKYLNADGTEAKDDPATKHINEATTGSDIAEWTLGEHSVRVEPPAETIWSKMYVMAFADTNTNYCDYLQGVADQVTAVSPALTSAELFQHAADGAIRASRRDYDPHSGLLLGSTAKTAMDSTRGSFGGIGIELTKKKGGPVLVAKPMEDNPAAKAGILKGDQITAINGRSTLTMTTSQFVDITRGKIGEPVTLTIKRGDQEPFDVQVTRDRVVPAVVEGKLIDGMGTADIKFTTFNEQTVPQFIKTMIRLANEAHDNAMKADDSRKTLRVILPDFSGNGGGLKDVAEILNDLLIDNEKEGCLRITASGKNNMEDLVCADSRYGPQIFEAVSEVAAVLFRGQGDDANSIYTYSALIYPWQVAKTLPPMTKVGTFETLSGRPHLEDQLFLGLNNANIFEVLKRLALSGAKDSAGNILVPIDVIENIEGRAKLEKKFAADLHQVPGLQLKSKMPDTGEKLTVLFVPAARQNSGSASASEITTGNLQDQKVAIIGESHGKGSVQVMFPIDAEGNFTRTGPNDPPQAALQKFTTGGFFPGQSGLSNHGSEGVPADILIENGDFRDEREKNAPREVNGLIPDDMKRHPSADRLQCSLKPAFRGTLGEARKKTLPEYMVTTVLNENEETGEIERVEVADTALACALAQVTGEKETAFVTIGPAPAPELKAP